MNLKTLHKILLWYLKKHGLMRLIKLFFIKGWRRINNKESVFFFDLDTVNVGSIDVSEKLTVVSHDTAETISPENMKQLIQLKSKEILLPFLDSFFHRGATLWLAKIDDKVAGLQWTIIGGFDGFYSFPMSNRDAIVLAVEVFQDYRGHSIWPAIMQLVCCSLKTAGISRIYLKVHVGNAPMQRSIRKTISKRIGTVREIHLFNKFIVIWDEK